MNLVYASRTGNVETIVSNLNINKIKIETGNEKVLEPFLIFTYTDGYGDIPEEVATFLEHNHQNLRGVFASGDKNFNEAFALSGDKISEQYQVKLLYKVENSGDANDIKAIQDIIASF